MKKTKLTRSLLAACSIVALTAVMYGCVHDGGSDPEPMVEPMPDPMPEPDPEPTDLENAQAAAKAAADAAKTASDSAAMEASGAADATMNLATMQTKAMAGDQAAMAKTHADAAMTAYMAAKAASDAAAAAEDAPTAIRAQIDAEAAQGDAEAAAMKASEYSEMAMASAMGELMIDGTMKSVGDTSVDAMAGASSVSMGSGDDRRTVVTGLIESMNPKTDGAANRWRRICECSRRRSEHGRHGRDHSGHCVRASRGGAPGPHYRQGAGLVRRHGSPDAGHSLRRRGNGEGL